MAHPPIRLVAGLGNPGRQHERDRHNVGFWLVSRLAEAEREATAARERLRSTDDRTRAADVSALEARLNLDALRESK